MDFDPSKENIQPLRGGRNVNQLEIALQAQTDSVSQGELLRQKEAFEEAIRNYEGEDPLDNWYNYISWVEQSYPKHGHEGNLIALLEDCLKKFEHDEHYIHDRRLCKLWIKYIDLQQNPLELFQLLHSQGICTNCADLYRAWAYYHEVAGDFKRANVVFQIGLRNLAQPYEDLVLAHENMFLAAGKQMVQGVDESRLIEQRQALTSLRTYKHHHRTVVASVRTGNQVLHSTPGMVHLGSSSRTERPNRPTSVYEDLNTAGPSMGASAARISILDIARRQEKVHKENTLKPGPWASARKGIASATVTQPRASSIKVHEDDEESPPFPDKLILPESFVSMNFDDFSTWKYDLSFPEPPNASHIPMYPKHLVYSDDTEYSFEEIRARKWFMKKQCKILVDESCAMQETMLADCNATSSNQMIKETQQAVQSILPDNNFSDNVTDCNSQAFEQPKLYQKNEYYNSRELQDFNSQDVRNVHTLLQNSSFQNQIYNDSKVATNVHQDSIPSCSASNHMHSSDNFRQNETHSSPQDQMYRDLKSTADFQGNAQCSGLSFQNNLRRNEIGTPFETQAFVIQNNFQELPQNSDLSHHRISTQNAAALCLNDNFRQIESHSYFLPSNYANQIYSDSEAISSFQDVSQNVGLLHHRDSTRNVLYPQENLSTLQNPLFGNQIYHDSKHFQNNASGDMVQNVLKHSEIHTTLPNTSFSNQIYHDSRSASHFQDNKESMQNAPNENYKQNKIHILQNSNNQIEIFEDSPKISRNSQNTNHKKKSVQNPAESFKLEYQEKLPSKPNKNEVESSFYMKEAMEDVNALFKNDILMPQKQPIQIFSETTAGRDEFSYVVDKKSTKSIPPRVLSDRPVETKSTEDKPKNLHNDTEPLVLFENDKSEPPIFGLAKRINQDTFSSVNKLRDKSTFPSQPLPEKKSSRESIYFSASQDLFKKPDSLEHTQLSTLDSENCNTEVFQLNLSSQKCSTPFNYKKSVVQQYVNSQPEEIPKTNKKKLFENETIEQKERDKLSIILETTESRFMSSSSGSTEVTTYKSSNFTNKEGLAVISEKSNSESYQISEKRDQSSNIFIGFSNTSIQSSLSQKEHRQIVREPLEYSKSQSCIRDDFSKLKNVEISPEKIRENIYDAESNDSMKDPWAASPVKSSKMEVDPNLLSQHSTPDFKMDTDSPEVVEQIDETILQKTPTDPFSSKLTAALLRKVKFPNARHLGNYMSVSNIPRIQRKDTVCLGDEKYLIEKILGKGTFGSVFKAVRLKNYETVAVKFQKPCNSWEFYICKEIQFRLTNPHMLKAFLDVSVGYFSKTSSLLVMEFCKYGSLLDVTNKIKQITGKGMKELVAIYFANEIVTIIHALHQCQIIHADIKPDNFLVMKMPPEFGHTSLKLIDFGCSIDMSLFPKGTSFTRVVSTEDFICSEMKEGRPWSYQTDLYCMAATIHVLLFEKYMQVQKRRDVWTITQRVPRYMRSDLWNTFFFELLNIKGCDKLPDLSELKSSFNNILSSCSEELQIDMRYIANNIHGR